MSLTIALLCVFCVSFPYLDVIFLLATRELKVSWSAQASKLAETFLASIDVCLPEWVTIDNEVK